MPEPREASIQRRDELQQLSDICARGMLFVGIVLGLAAGLGMSVFVLAKTEPHRLTTAAVAAGVMTWVAVTTTIAIGTRLFADVVAASVLERVRATPSRVSHLTRQA